MAELMDLREKVPGPGVRFPTFDDSVNTTGGALGVRVGRCEPCDIVWLWHGRSLLVRLAFGEARRACVECGSGLHGTTRQAHPRGGWRWHDGRREGERRG
jgi:hypothetical protein